jgi:hypothetical protein
MAAALIRQIESHPVISGAVVLIVLTVGGILFK